MADDPDVPQGFSQQHSITVFSGGKSVITISVFSHATESVVDLTSGAMLSSGPITIMSPVDMNTGKALPNLLIGNIIGPTLRDGWK